jgi:hypothetical protein
MKEFIIKYYIQLIIIASLFGAIGYVLFESRQIMIMIGEKSLELKQVQMDRVLTAEYIQNIHIFKKNSKHIDENIGLFDVILPDTDDAKVDLFSDLEKMASDAGLARIVLAVKQEDVKKKSKDTSADKTEDKALGIHIAVIGSYNDLLHYLQKIENMQYLSSITSFDIQKMSIDQVQREGVVIEEGVAGNFIKANMMISFYLLSSEE